MSSLRASEQTYMILPMMPKAVAGEAGKALIAGTEPQADLTRSVILHVAVQPFDKLHLNLNNA
jgi:hypothetical protein